MENILEYQMTKKWKVSCCHTGKSCWCRMIVLKDTNDLKNQNLSKSEIEDKKVVVGAAELTKDLAKYIVKLHNEDLDRKNKVKNSDDNLKFKLEDFITTTALGISTIAYVLKLDEWEFEFNTANGEDFYIEIGIVEIGKYRKVIEKDLKNSSFDECLKFINEFVKERGI